MAGSWIKSPDERIWEEKNKVLDQGVRKPDKGVLTIKESKSS